MRRQTPFPAEPRLGAHVSTAGGLACVWERAERIGATALQLFVKPPRRWEAPPLDPAEARRFRRRAAETGLAPFTLAHADYLINLAAPPGELRERSIAALRLETERCERLGIPQLVVHPGARGAEPELPALCRVAEALDDILAPGRTRAAAAGTVRVLLETVAGQGSALGWSFDQLRFVFERARSTPRLGVCFDTCHVLAAGYEFRDGASYRATLERIERSIGLAQLRAFHLNDSRHPLGSRRDCHEHIGRGHVGLEAFRLILADARFRELPMVLETPKGPELVEDRENLTVLRSLLPRTER